MPHTTAHFDHHGNPGEKTASNETNNVDRGIVKVAVYYGTDRKLVGGQYSGERNPANNPLKYGICYVSIPPDHRIGLLEGPRWTRLEFRPNPQKHIVLETVSEIGRHEVFESIRLQFQNHPTGRRRMLIFIHGFNVSFADAARRSAQIHYDLNFQGLSSIFSWPSDGNARSYVADAADIEWSTKHIESFLRDLNQSKSIDDVFLIAHSMGNRGAIEALRRLAAQDEGKKIKEIILAAPDVDSMVFDRDISSSLSDYYPRLTVYASANDLALWSSDILSKVPRVGEIRDGEPTILSRANLDIIDATNVETGFFGAFVLRRGDLRDLRYLSSDPRKKGAWTENKLTVATREWKRCILDLPKVAGASLSSIRGFA